MSLFDIFTKKAGRDYSSEPGVNNPKRVMPYGDILGDGALQMSFTLPVAPSPEAKEGAKRYIEKLGLKDVLIAHMEGIGNNLSYFVVYGHAKHAFDITKVKVPKADYEKMNLDEVVEFARKNIKRKITIVGATTGTDAHTVGLDAIMNMKGYMGDFGLERYDCFKTINLRSQVSHEELLARAVRLNADVILVSKVVSQRDKHIEELKVLGAALAKEKGLKKSLIKIVGGPRLNHAQALKVGFDAGFGHGTLPSEVASFIVQEYARRNVS